MRLNDPNVLISVRLREALINLRRCHRRNASPYHTVTYLIDRAGPSLKRQTQPEY